MVAMQERKMVVLGGSSGIGLATARLLAEQGASVTIGGLHEAHLAEAKKTLAHGARAIPVDATDADDTTGNSPGTKWTAFNAIAEQLDYRPPIHQPHQPGAALVRGHLAQAAGARPGDSGLSQQAVAGA